MLPAIPTRCMPKDYFKENDVRDTDKEELCADIAQEKLRELSNFEDVSDSTDDILMNVKYIVENTKVTKVKQKATVLYTLINTAYNGFKSSREEIEEHYDKLEEQARDGEIYDY